MNLPTILQGDSLVRLMQGAAAGCALTLLVGFGWGGWQLQSKSEKLSQESATSAMIKALTPICVAKFQQASGATASMVALKATDSWKQDTFVREGGWATFPGATEPNREVAEACARMLTEVK